MDFLNLQLEGGSSSLNFAPGPQLHRKITTCSSAFPADCANMCNFTKFNRISRSIFASVVPYFWYRWV